MRGCCGGTAAPPGIFFVPAFDSPTGNPLFVVVGKKGDAVTDKSFNSLLPIIASVAAIGEIIYACSEISDDVMYIWQSNGSAEAEQFVQMHEIDGLGADMTTGETDLLQYDYNDMMKIVFGDTEEGLKFLSGEGIIDDVSVDDSAVELQTEASVDVTEEADVFVDAAEEIEEIFVDALDVIVATL